VKGVMIMYLNYWNLSKHPFNNVPDPEMYFNMHQSVDEAVSEVLFAIEEANECLAVVVGKVGVGKTTCLRIVLDSLNHDKYSIAYVTNPDMTFAQILREIVGQLEGQECTESHKVKLLERFNSLLFKTNDAGKKVVVFIDEGNAIRPHNLESLRLLTNMQDDHQNLFTIVLAGQPELAKKLEDPRRENLFQRIGVYCHIKGIDSRETMKDYINHRLERSGLSGRSVFTEDAYDALWELSDKGVPRLINKICKLAMKAGETNNLQVIDGEVVQAVGAQFARVHRKVNKGRKPAVAVEDKPAVKVEEKSVEKKEEKAQNNVPPPEEAVGANSGVTLKVDSREEREKIASKIATERIKHMGAVLDPFEAWTKAREEILKKLDGMGKPQPVIERVAG